MGVGVAWVLPTEETRTIETHERQADPDDHRQVGLSA